MFIALTACLGIVIGVLIERYARQHALLVKARRYVASSPVWILGPRTRLVDEDGNIVGECGRAQPAGLAFNDQEAIEQLLKVSR